MTYLGIFSVLFYTRFAGALSALRRIGTVLVRLFGILGRGVGIGVRREE